MSKLGGFFARKASLYDRADEPAQRTDVALPPDQGLPEAAPTALNPLELDEDLFTALGAQIGGENELLRNLLLDANAKAGELDAVKAAVARLVEPVSKALRAFETERAEKVGLQTVLNNTRTAYGKLRNEVAELEKRAAAAEQDGETLRRDLTAAQEAVRTAEAAKAAFAVETAARKAQIADLEGRLAQESGETKLAREENRRQSERLAAADKRIVTAESDLNSTRQRLLMTEDEKRAQQAALEKTSAESARIARKLAEMETAFIATQGRLRQAETNIAEANGEASRLQAALDEANERRELDVATQRVRFDTLQARTTASEKLLAEAHEHLVARAEEIRDYDHRNTELARERDALSARLADLEAGRIARESQFQELEQVRAALLERGSSLARAFSVKDAALARAEETIASLNDRVAGLEETLAAERESLEQGIEELTAALKREKMERAVAEGALESARKDFARLLRELMALQRNQNAADDPAALRPANAA